MTRRGLEDIFAEAPFEGQVRFMEPMRNHTSLRIGGPADVFAIPPDTSSLVSMHMHLRNNRVSLFPLGGGTNILVRDGGIEGAVISLRALQKVEFVREDDEHVYVHVRAGAPLQGLVSFSKAKGYSGLEGLAGIPGTVGGAICGNSGAFGYEMKDVLVSVEIINASGETVTLKREQMTFGYRTSGISQQELLLAAEIRLRKDREEAVSARVADFLKMKRERQPVWERSAGCVFRNPAGLSAGKLIEEAGCKGMRRGGVEVSTVHANFFVNKGKASAADYTDLMREVAGRVRERFGVILDPEIRIVGRERVEK